MKYAPRKVFILENGSYKELSYEKFCSLKEKDSIYADKFFIPLHSMLMEVTEETYRDFYKTQRRRKYINERSATNGDFSYEEILIDNSEDIATEVVHKIMLDKLRNSILLLPDDDQNLIWEIFFEELSERTLAEKYGVSQVAIHKRKVKILDKLKKILNGEC